MNGAQSKEFEDCQRHALQVVLGAQSSSYSANLKRLSLDRLSDRRSDLILKFAISTFKNPKHRSWYTPSPPPELTRQIPPRLIVPQLRTEYSENSMPLTTYTRVLNGLTETEWEDYGLPPVNTCHPKPNVQISRIYPTKFTRYKSTCPPSQSHCSAHPQQSLGLVPPHVVSQPPACPATSAPPATPSLHNPAESLLFSNLDQIHELFNFFEQYPD